jgi:hypothetical protein
LSERLDAAARSSSAGSAASASNWSRSSESIFDRRDSPRSSPPAAGLGIGSQMASSSTLAFEHAATRKRLSTVPEGRSRLSTNEVRVLPTPSAEPQSDETTDYTSFIS